MMADGATVGGDPEFRLCDTRAELDASEMLMELAEAVKTSNASAGQFDNVGMQTFENAVALQCRKESGMFVASGICGDLAVTQAVFSRVHSEQAEELHAKARHSEKLSNILHSTDNEDRTRSTDRLYAASHGVVLRDVIAVSYSSHMVHLGHLEHGTVQRKQFPKLAAQNCPGVAVVPYGRMDAPPNYSDIQRVLNDSSKVTRPKILVIELPQRMNGGGTMRLEDLRATSALARRFGVHLHLDGRRLGEVVPFYAIGLGEICALFDTVCLAFDGSVGAMAGAMVLGTADFIDGARVERHRMGGAPASFFPMWLNCQQKWNTLGNGMATYRARFDRLCQLVETIKRELVPAHAPIRFVPEVPTSCMIHVYVRGELFDLQQVGTAATERSGVQVWDRLRGQGFGASLGRPNEYDPWFYFEWTMGEQNMTIPVSQQVKGWAELCKVLHLYHKYRQTPEVHPSALGIVPGAASRMDCLGIPSASSPVFQATYELVDAVDVVGWAGDELPKWEQDASLHDFDAPSRTASLSQMQLQVAMAEAAEATEAKEAVQPAANAEKAVTSPRPHKPTIKASRFTGPNKPGFDSKENVTASQGSTASQHKGAPLWWSETGPPSFVRSMFSGFASGKPAEKSSPVQSPVEEPVTPAPIRGKSRWAQAQQTRGAPMMKRTSSLPDQQFRFKSTPSPLSSREIDLAGKGSAPEHVLDAAADPKRQLFAGFDEGPGRLA